MKKVGALSNLRLKEYHTFIKQGRTGKLDFPSQVHLSMA